MSTKTDELMRLADEYAKAYHHDECGHFPEGASRPMRASLRSAIQEVERDAERYRWMREQIKTINGKTFAQAMLWNCSPSRTKLDAAIDAAMQPEPPEADEKRVDQQTGSICACTFGNRCPEKRPFLCQRKAKSPESS